MLVLDRTFKKPCGRGLLSNVLQNKKKYKFSKNLKI